MLLLYIFLLSCCLSGSMGGAIEEFKETFEALVDQASEEMFLLVPAGKFQCNHVPCQLRRTIDQLKADSKNDQMRTRISVMEKNMDRITSALNIAHTKREKESSCLMAERSPQDALKPYKRFFEKLYERC